MNLSKLTDKQHQLYSAVIDHARGKSDARTWYPGLDHRIIEDARLAEDHPEAIKSLARNTGSKQALGRWHRKVYGKAGGIGSTAAKIGTFLVEKGVSLAKKAWSTASACAKSLARLGQKALTWVANNPKKIQNIVSLIKDGISIGQALGQMTGGPIAPTQYQNIDPQQTKEVDAVIESSTDEESWGDEDEKKSE